LSDSTDKSAVSMRVADAVTAVGIFLLGLIVIWDSRRLGAGWASDGPEPGYFPFYIGLILCVASVINLFNAVRTKAGQAEKANASFVSVSSLKMVLSVLIPTVVYACMIGGVGPIPGLGIYVSSVFFIAAFMIWLGKYKWLLSLTVGIAVPVVFFLLFGTWFKVPLPKGPLEALLGLD
jgi:putative tricarboxylic transport membrane protein